MKKSSTVVIFIIVLAVVAAGSFYGGMLYKASQTPARRGGFGTGNVARFATGASFSTGTIVSLDNQSITLKTQNGSSRVIFYSDATEVGEFTTGKTSDLQTGDNIMVSGKTNSDGSITAQSIQIRPANMIPNPTPSK